MDSTAAAAATIVPPPPPSGSPCSSTPRSTIDPWISSTAGERIRLMCSYGGCIVPRPTDKALRYLGGETRIVAVDRLSPFSDLQSRLSQTLPLSYQNFTIKYQLPSEDLDSLISLASDEDLDNLIDEYDRISATKPGARIRLFIFPETPPPVGSLLADSSKAEAWFVDALNGTTIPGKGSADSASVNSLLGLDEQPSSAKAPQEKVVSRQQDVQSVPDSPMLETAHSSFGSTSSAFSMSNLPPIRVRVEEQSGGIEEQFSQMNVASSAIAPASQKTEDTTDNGETFFASDEKSEHGDGMERTTSSSHVPSITDPITRQGGVPVSVPIPVQILPTNAAAHMTTLMNADQLRQFAQQQQQQPQYVHANPSYVHPQTGNTSHLPGYYQMPFPIQQPQTQAQSYSLDQHLPYYFFPVQHPPPLPYNLIPQASVADVNKSSAMQEQNGGAAIVYGTAPAAVSKSVPPATPTVPIIHPAADNAHPYTGGTYYHLLHHNHSSSIPASYPYGIAPPAGSQVYYTQAAAPPQYQTVSGSASLPEASVHMQHPDLNQAREL